MNQAGSCDDFRFSPIFFSLPTILRWNKFALFPHFFRLVFFPVACPISNHFHVTKVCSFGHDGGGGENCFMLFFCSRRLGLFLSSSTVAKATHKTGFEGIIQFGPGSWALWSLGFTLQDWTNNFVRFTAGKYRFLIVTFGIWEVRHGIFWIQIWFAIISKIYFQNYRRASTKNSPEIHFQPILNLWKAL